MKKLTTKLIFLSILSLILSTVIPRTILILTDQSPDREVLQSVIVLWAVIVTGIIALILYSFIIKFLIINRINKISEHTIDVTQGYFDREIEIKGNDEISVLAKNFNIIMF